jgi:GNAT superfamily N-acetyltransferase
MAELVIARDYAGAADLPALLDFASRSLTARFPREALWHPGDVVWELKTARNALEIRLWEAGSLGAVAVLPGDGQLWLECLPEQESLFAETIAWAETRMIKQRDWLGPTLSVKLFDRDTHRIATLEARGYRRAGPEGVRFRRALDQPIDPAPLPEGIHLRDCVGVDPERRAAAHRHAWNHLAHIGIENARSSFTARTYGRLLASPVYDPSLDILAETADGRLAANVISWADEASGVGTFEPVGTHVDFRRQGLARAVNVEALRRLQSRGLAWARVSTAHFNAPAIATYLSCGFEIIDRTSLWAKSLA